jgi:hypothetical protein
LVKSRENKPPLSGSKAERKADTASAVKKRPAVKEQLAVKDQAAVKERSAVKKSAKSPSSNIKAR